MRTVVAALALLLVSGSAGGIETDQFFSWGRPLEDSTDVINARVNAELEDLVRALNEEHNPSSIPCDKIRARFNGRFRMLIFNGLELWAINSPLVSRVPGDGREIREYRRSYLYHATSPMDTGTWMPPSPTVLVHGVRIGTDKLTHLLGTSWYYHRWYRSFRKGGASHEEAVRRTLERGTAVENTILGKAASGVFSPGDLEANYHGMIFFNELCGVDDPTLAVENGLWVLRRPFDLRDFVTPEWDESYQPPAFTKRRWKKVEPVLVGYCDRLEDPDVRALRESYARRDTTTVTELFLQEKIAEGKLVDPGAFSIESVCKAHSRSPSSSADPDTLDRSPSAAASDR
jgi:hypothetical protein